MKSTTRLFLLLVAILILVLVLGACGKKDPSVTTAATTSADATTTATTTSVTTTAPVTTESPLIFVSHGDGTCAVMGVKEGNTVTEIVIPELSPEGDTVTTIVYGAFFDDFVTSVWVPATVTNIRSEGFRYCDSLTIYCEVESEPEGWEYNWNQSDCPVVWNCKENSVASDGHIYTVIDGVRYGLDYTTAVVPRQSSLLVTATILPSITYQGNTYTVNEIVNYAFSDNGNLLSVTIPETVTRVGEDVIWLCSAATVYCEATEKPSGWDTGWCAANTPVVWDCRNTDIANDGYEYVVIDGLRYALKDGEATVARQTTTLTTATIPSSVTYLGVSYPVTALVDCAFSDCRVLTAVSIPSTVTDIGGYTFSSCAALADVQIPGSVTGIGEYAFAYCETLQTLAIPASVERISSYAFYECTALLRVTFGEESRLTSINAYAFRNCRAMETVTIPISVTWIGTWAFQGCISLDIYCEAPSKPDSWASDWYPSNNPVMYGQKAPS